MHAEGRRSALRWVWPLPRLLAVLAIGAFAAWEGPQGRYSSASHASILAAVAAVLLLAVAAGRGHQRWASRTWVRAAVRRARDVVRGRDWSAARAGALVWVLLVAATVAWDAVSFTAQRHSLPTLSRLFGAVTDHQWGRAALFAGWLALGLYLAVGWRRPGRDARAGGTGTLPRRGEPPAGSPPAARTVPPRGGVP